jgi:hypothetical protein
MLATQGSTWRMMKKWHFRMRLDENSRSFRGMELIHTSVLPRRVRGMGLINMIAHSTRGIM